MFSLFWWLTGVWETDTTINLFVSNNSVDPTNLEYTLSPQCSKCKTQILSHVNTAKTGTLLKIKHFAILTAVLLYICYLKHSLSIISYAVGLTSWRLLFARKKLLNIIHMTAWVVYLPGILHCCIGTIYNLHHLCRPHRLFDATGWRAEHSDSPDAGKPLWTRKRNGKLLSI